VLSIAIGGRRLPIRASHLSRSGSGDKRQQLLDWKKYMGDICMLDVVRGERAPPITAWAKSISKSMALPIDVTGSRWAPIVSEG